MRVLLILVASIALAQNPESVSWPSTAATDTDTLVLSNSAQSTLNGAINNSTLTVVVASGASFTAPLAIRIDNEIIKVCSKATHTFTVCTGGRGFDGSTAASHSDGASVYAYYIRYNHNILAAYIKALTGSGLWATAAFANDNRLLRSDGAGRGVQASGITVDDSDNIITPGTVTAAGFSSGGSPPACTAGTAGFMCDGEGTAPTGKAAGVDVCYADSTAHAYLCSFHDDTYSRMARYSDALSSFVQSVPSEAYDATNWNGDAGPPQKNDIRDYLESIAPAGVVADAAIASTIARDSEVSAAYCALAGCTMSGALAVVAEAYDATGWNGDTGAPQKDAIRDYLESLFPAGAIVAATGDSATGFFPSGTIEDARLPSSMADKVITGSLAAPQGSAPTVDAAGEIAVDTSSDQFKFYGAAARALPSIQYASFVIAAPATTDDINLMKAPYGMTILGIDAIVQGTTSATGQLQECASDGTSCADLDSDIVADADGAADDGTLTDSAIASGAWIRWKTTSVSGTPTFLTVTVRYRVVPD
jgi:hypothetical protein